MYYSAREFSKEIPNFAFPRIIKLCPQSIPTGANCRHINVR